MANEIRVLIVDDEPSITDLVAMGLSYEGMTVAVAESGSEALRRVETFRPDLLVLDVMLPDIDGFEVMRRLSDVRRPPPVVFLSARGELEDKLRGFTLGGDEYVTKPFSMEELVVRIRSILARSTRVRGESTILEFADLVLNEEQHEVHRGAAMLKLTPTEFKLLHYLLLNPNRIMSRAQMRAGLAAGLRRTRQRSGDIHQLTAPQDGGPWPPLDPHRARAWLSLASTGRLRWRCARGSFLL